MDDNVHELIQDLKQSSLEIGRVEAQHADAPWFDYPARRRLQRKMESYKRHHTRLLEILRTCLKP